MDGDEDRAEENLFSDGPSDEVAVADPGVEGLFDGGEGDTFDEELFEERSGEEGCC